MFVSKANGRSPTTKAIGDREGLAGLVFCTSNGHGFYRDVHHIDPAYFMRSCESWGRRSKPQPSGKNPQSRLLRSSVGRGVLVINSVMALATT